MKAIHWTIAATALACTEPVQAGINDPEVIIYRFPGVRDDGGASEAGVATSFHCTNFSGVTENVRFATRNFDAALKSNVVRPVLHLTTITVSTHGTNAYFEDQTL